MGKGKLMALFASILCLQVYAQQDDYKLDRYVNPDFKRQSLDFNLGTNGSFRSEKRTYNSDDYSDDWGSQNLSGNLKLDYNRIKNSKKVQSRMNAAIHSNGNYLNEEQSGTNNKGYSVDLFFNDNAYYYMNDKKFIEFSPSAQFHIRDNKDKTESSDSAQTDRRNTLYTFVSFKLGVGKGRIEHVEDARQAMYILSDLQKNNTLKRTLNDDEINALARQMTVIKNKRQFDSRIKLIEEITTVDSFLVANGYIDAANTAPYFTSLYDNWMYAGLIERLSGARFSIGITPNYSFSKIKRTYSPEEYPNYNYDDIYSVVSGAVYASYEYEKPVNLYWQRSAGVTATETLGKRRNEDDNYWNTELSGYYKMGYYPNSRTYMTGSINQSFSYEDSDYQFFDSRSTVAFDIYYYLSR